MGIICSGVVSNAASYFPAENTLLSNRTFVQSVGLVTYFRFKDDIIAFLDGPNNNPDLFFGDAEQRVVTFHLGARKCGSVGGGTFRCVSFQTARAVQIQLQGAREDDQSMDPPWR
ncbi:unnamed protein product [Prorocentrum cordatum]|uniref:Uncharacterized protein n=1 Tax=Prorocentrum cordatum TaxID=2364126 RepID=A0ABN9PCN3_9DINO|nr:unnamed protein product [Polarella glacialis]